MKSSVNDSAENKQDLLLFAYLEGELNESQKRELEAKLILDPGLQLEMESWKEAFIEQDFYDTIRLEESLLGIAAIPHKAWYTKASVYMFVCALGISLFSFLPLNKQERAFIKGKKATPGKTISLRESIVPTKLPKMMPIIKETLSEKIISETSVERALPEIATKEAAITSTISNPAIPEKVIKKVRIKKEDSHAISRKAQRSISRKKEKALQERKAREFMKGNRAYVVPLNTQNF